MQSKKLIAITMPHFFSDESVIISELLESGLDRIHIRKPEASITDMRKLLGSIPNKFHNKISLHDCYSLTKEFPEIGGLHLNRRNSAVPESFKGIISRSCHSIEELNDSREYDYLFLSPIFDSISKEGYGSGFSMEELNKASLKGVINNKVYALGGIDTSNIPHLKSLSFGGIAVLGALWGKHPSIKDIDTIVKRLNNLILCLQQY